MLLALSVSWFAGCDTRNRTIHDSFAITASDLAEMTAPLPEEIRRDIGVRSWFFLELVDDILAEPAPFLVLVDKYHPLPAEYTPPDLVSLDDYRVTAYRELLISRSVMPDLLSMVEAARIDDVELAISSTYRSYEYQSEVYARHVSKYGREQADRESARPGKSQHQLGTTIDFGSVSDEFADTDAGRWLIRRAWEFGFSLSYPNGYEELTGYRHEVWHYRYIGRTASRLEQEFFGSVQQYMLEFLHANRSGLQAANE